jgi:hypothetical protein
MLTVYNHERFVAEAIESVLAQDWPEDRIECIVLDDGSTDGTLDVIHGYRDRVRVIHQANQGVRAVVNRLMDEMRGEVITCIAGDDAFKPDRLRVQVDALRENPTAGLVYTDEEIIDAEGRMLAPSFMAEYGLTGYSGRIRGKLLTRNFVSGGGCMLRGCLKPAVHPIPDAAVWEDYWWAWAMSGVADVVYVPVVTYRYRLHGANLSLGAVGDRLTAGQREELRFRRWMLGQVRPGEATATDLIDGIYAFHGVLRVVADASGAELQDVMPVTPAERAEADRHLAEAMREADTTKAAFACASAVAADPANLEAIGLALELMRRERAVPSPELDVRSFVVVADADEVLAEPELIAAYAAGFGDTDDATLVIHGAGRTVPALEQELVALLGRLDLADEQVPDMIAVTEPAVSRDALLKRADAVLGRAGPSPVPRFGGHAIDSLHHLFAGQRSCTP